MRDEYDTAGKPGEEPFQPFEPGEVEVVRRLVEEEHVEAREQDRRQRDTSRLAAREQPHPLPGGAGESDIGERHTCARREVVAAEGEKAIERLRVRRRESRLRGQPFGDRVHLGGCRRHAGPPGERFEDRLLRLDLGSCGR